MYANKSTDFGAIFFWIDRSEKKICVHENINYIDIILLNGSCLWFTYKTALCSNDWTKLHNWLQSHQDFNEQIFLLAWKEKTFQYSGCWKNTFNYFGSWFYLIFGFISLVGVAKLAVYKPIYFSITKTFRISNTEPKFIAHTDGQYSKLHALQRNSTACFVLCCSMKISSDVIRQFCGGYGDRGRLQGFTVWLVGSAKRSVEQEYFGPTRSICSTRCSIGQIQMQSDAVDIVKPIK